MKTLAGVRGAAPLIRTVVGVAAILGLLVGTSVASWAANGDEGWWPDYDQPGFWWGTQSVTEYEGDLVVSGDFWFVDGQPLRLVVRRSGNTWVPMGNGLAGSLDDLTVFQGKLVGLTGRRGHDTAASLRAWDGSTWSIVAGQPVSIQKLLVLSSGRLLAVAANGLHLWNGNEWSDYGPAGSFDLPVTEYGDGIAIAYSNGQVVIVRESGIESLGNPGGPVTLLGMIDGRLVRGVRIHAAPEWETTTRGQIQAWDGNAWEDMGHLLDRAPTHLLIGPEGPEIMCQQPRYSYKVGQQTRRWDGSNWVPTGVWFDYAVSEWKQLGDRRVAAGNFWVADGCAARGIAIDDGSGYRPVRVPQSPVGGADLPVHALMGFRGQVVAGGTFITIGETASPFLAIGDGRNWSPLGDGVDDGVFALTEYNGDLIVAGDFQTAGGIPASRVARWDGSQWHAMGNGLDGCVRALAVSGGKLFAGGDFERTGTQVAGHLAVWDGSTWSPVVDFDRPVYALAEFQGHLYVGGLFQHVAGAPCPYLARQDGQGWTRIQAWNGAVLALTTHEGNLAIGGQMRDYDDQSRSVSLWNGQRFSWITQNPLSSVVRTMVSTPKGLVVGGDGYLALGSLARWNGNDWESLGSGINGSVQAIARVNGSLFIGGAFLSAGGRRSERLARWDDGLVPAVVGGVTVDRDDDEVRLTWNAGGMTNLSSIEVWVGPEAAGIGERPAFGQGTLIGIAQSGLDNAFEFVDASTRSDGARYWLRQLGPFGSDSWSGPYALAPLPPGARIQSIGPNPFFGGTQVHYTLARAGMLTIEVFDTQGRRIRVLQRGDHPAGVFELEWDGRSDTGASVAAGTYWVRLATRDGIQSRRILRLN